MNSFELQAKLFKALNHPVRLEILDILRDGEQCVCHLETALGYRQAYISQHLTVLRSAGVLQDRRDGWNVFYRVVMPQIYEVIDAGSDCVHPDRKSPRRPIRVNNPSLDCPCPKCADLILKDQDTVMVVDNASSEGKQA